MQPKTTAHSPPRSVLTIGGCRLRFLANQSRPAQFLKLSTAWPAKHRALHSVRSVSSIQIGLYSRVLNGANVIEQTAAKLTADSHSLSVGIENLGSLWQRPRCRSLRSRCLTVLRHHARQHEPHSSCSATQLSSGFVHLVPRSSAGRASIS